MFGVFARKEKFEEREYRVYDIQQGKEIKTKGKVNIRTKLAIRKAEKNGYVIDILVDKDVLFANLRTEELAKEIILDDFVQSLEWRKKGAKDKYFGNEDIKFKLRMVKDKYEIKKRQRALATENGRREAEQKENHKNEYKEPTKKQEEVKRVEAKPPMKNGIYTLTKQDEEHNAEKMYRMVGSGGKMITMQEKNGKFALFFENKGERIRLTESLNKREDVLRIQKVVEKMYDWYGKGYPFYYTYKPKINESGRFIGKIVKAYNENKKAEEKIPESLYIEMYFSGNQKIINRYQKYLDLMYDLENMIGMDKVKKQIKDLTLQLVGKFNVGIEQKNHGMHMVFSGPAGTGKTVVAELITGILYTLGYLEKEHVVKATRDVLVGEHIGGSEQKTMEKIEEAMGGVLFIDEAYSLYKEGASNDFGMDVVNILIKEMEDRRSEFIVILAGYEKEMHQMIRMNPGLQSRIKYQIDFEDYTTDQLLKIAEKMEQGIFNTSMTKEARVYFEKVLEGKKMQGRVDGNARTVRVMLEKISTKYFASMVGQSKAQKVTENHIKMMYSIEDKEQKGKERMQSVMKKMDGLYGLKELKKSMDIYIKQVQWQKRREENGLGKFEMDRMHMAFLGPAGTGKTTVAEIMAEFLTSLGVLKNNVVITATRSDLVGEYQGHTAIKMKSVIERAMGGVLFIDEAYSLVNGENDTFGNEAVTELIAAMEKYKRDFIVILAGYEKDVNELLETNQGFNSRIAKKFVFDAYKPKDIYRIMLGKIEKENYKITNEARKILEQELVKYANKNGGKFDGNGRWAENMTNKLEDMKIQTAIEKGKDIEKMTKEEMVTIGTEEVRMLFSE